MMALTLLMICSSIMLSLISFSNIFFVYRERILENENASNVFERVVLEESYNKKKTKNLNIYKIQYSKLENQNESEIKDGNFFIEMVQNENNKCVFLKQGSKEVRKCIIKKGDF